MNPKKGLVRAIIGSAFLLGADARADMLGGLGKWQGAGSFFEADGRPAGDFSVELTRTALDPQTVETRGQATLASGQVVAFEQRMSGHGAQFSLESDRGRGGGFCFGAGLCQT